MKKIFLAIIAATVALGFTACNPGTADVKWKAGTNPAGAGGFSDIKWENEAGIADTTWINDPLYATDDETGFKEVSELVGKGSCLDDGTESEIVIDNSSSGGVTVAIGGGSALLDENAEVTLVIGGTNPVTK